MPRFKALSSAVGLLFAIASQVNAAPYVHCGGAYVVLEPFFAKWDDDGFDHSNRDISFCSRQDNNDFHFDDRWNLGGRIALGYDFPSCTPCFWGVSLEYTQLTANRSRTDRNFESAFGTLNGTGPSIIFGPLEGRIHRDYHTLDLLGHYHFGRWGCLRTELFGGLRYANIDERARFHHTETINNRVEPIPTNGNTPGSTLLQTNGSLSTRLLGDDEVRQTFNREFNGIGPYIGLNLRVPFGSCFGFIAQIGGSALDGNRDNDFRERHLNDNSILIPGTTTGTSIVGTDGLGGAFTDHAFDNRRHHNRDHNDWVGGVHARLGLAYDSCFNCNWLSIELGYRYDRYFNLFRDRRFVNTCDSCDQFSGIDSITGIESITGINSGLGTISDCGCGDDHHRGDHDIEIQGPYFSLTFHV